MDLASTAVPEEIYYWKPIKCRNIKRAYIMDRIFEVIQSNSILFALLIVLLALLVYALLKRIMKIVIILIIALGIYSAYLYYTGQDIPEEAKRIYEITRKTILELKERGENTINTILENDQ